jgi:hypothetical protein
LCRNESESSLGAASAPRGKSKKSSKKPEQVERNPAAKAARSGRPKKPKIVGEGDYQASRSFLKDQSDFVVRHSADIPAMGKTAEAALEGPEGGELRVAEEDARGRSKAVGE